MRRASRTVPVVVLLAVLAGCAGSPTSTSAWSDTTDKTIGQAVSSLGTVKIVLEAQEAHSLTKIYSVESLTDAVSTADGEVSKYDTVQPPDDQHHLAREVTAALHAAVRLLSRIRVEYASPGLGAGRAAALAEQVSAAMKQLDRLTTRVDGATS